MVAPNPYIAIEGVIGVGKTTLARYLKDALAADLLLEVFEENPFLSDFYADRSRYAFQTQIFFLLSRYRQQHQVIPRAIEERPLISDYLFDKDWLFAHLNLVNDELAVYEHLYHALNERIPGPALVVYLRAGVDTLLERIAIRDRAYERNMSRAYIADLHRAYDLFFDDYAYAPVLTINTDDLNIVSDRDARQAVIGQVKEALARGASQPQLPIPEKTTPSPPTTPAALLPDTARHLPDFQKFHQTLDRLKGFETDLYINYILLNEEIGELGSEIAQVWGAQNKLNTAGAGRENRLDHALQAHRPQLAGELADCLAYLLKLANYTGIDLEAAYLAKMRYNITRVWSEKSGLAHQGASNTHSELEED